MNVLIRYSFVVLALHSLTGVAQSVSVNVSVDATAIGYRINDDFVGLSFEGKTMTTPTGGGSTVGSFWEHTPTALAQFRNLMANLSPNPVIRIGANGGDRLAWTPGSRGSSTDVNKLFNSDIDKFFNFVASVNGKGIYQINFAKDSANYAGNAPTESASESSYVYSTYGSRLKSVSIGNEPMAYVVNKYRNPYTPSLYVANYLPVYDAIKAANSAIPISGGDIGRRTEYNTWNSAYLQKMNNLASTTPARPIDAFNIHIYPYRADEFTGTTAQWADTLINSNRPGSIVQTNLSYLKGLSESYNAPFWISETNSIASSVAGVSNTFVSAIWGLDYLYVLASYNVKGANIHSGGNSLSYAPVYRASTSSTYAIGSLYYGLLAFVDGARNQRLLSVTPPNSTTNPRASYYATISDDSQTINVTLINKDFTNTINAAVNVPGININAASYQTLRPQTSIYDLASANYYANAQVAADGTFTEGTPTALSITNNTQFSLTLAPMTAVVVTLMTNTIPLYTVKSGAWTDASVWSQNRVPTSADVVVLKHTVTIPANNVVHAQRVVYSANNPLQFGQDAQLQEGL